jgi:hypothetical protein
MQRFGRTIAGLLASAASSGPLKAIAGTLPNVDWFAMNVRDAIREYCRESTNACRHNTRRRQDDNAADDESDVDDDYCPDKVLCECVKDMHVTPNQVLI